ncbi:hypothetical protein A6840_19190 [Salmonella enterica]|nr:hypothetical protein [Salmonella enterica]EBQ3613169.1 hypothetical protein [Salmonella enterica]
MPAFEWVHVQLHQQKGMISLSPPTICNSALMAGSSPSLPDGSNPSAAIVQSASDVQCSRLLKTTNLVGI